MNFLSRLLWQPLRRDTNIQEGGGPWKCATTFYVTSYGSGHSKFSTSRVLGRVFLNCRSSQPVSELMSMARDVWRWCKVHQKWLQDVNACVTQKGLEHVKTDSAPRSFSPSSRSVFSSRLNCTESSGKKLHKGSVAASNRWRDDSNTLDPVPNFTAKKDKKQDNFRQNISESENWVTVFSSVPDHDPGGRPDRFDTSELLDVIREFEKCGTIVERVVGPDAANWIQLQFQSSQEAGQALMKSGLRLKGGTTVICRNLDEKQRKQLLLGTISKSGNQLGPGPSSSNLPKSHGSVDGNFSEEELPKSSLSKFVDLVFDSDRYHQITPAGYIIPIRFEPGLYKELFKSQIHHCDAFVTPQCDPAANQPLFFEYPWKPTDPCDYTLRKIEELQDRAQECLASSMPSQGLISRPTGKTCCDENTWRNNDLVNHS
ncbi:uncharacterized protein [Physcomitrium patens]|uniref:uncharacterized protein isoform X2 n=1 Tax=Physcomitrium patens TaxID=3218 RepID=UPI003CCD9CA6